MKFRFGMITTYPSAMDRIRITHPYDLYRGKIGYVIETIDQHSLCTYVVRFKGVEDKRAYQRQEFKFLKPVKSHAKFLFKTTIH